MELPPGIHPTALVSPQARLAPDVRVGAFCLIEGEVALGPGCALYPRAHLEGPLTAGRGNRFLAGCVIGGAPQHLLHAGEATSTAIGEGNTFEEGATVHRAALPGGVTRLGNSNRLGPASHVGHDCQVGNGCTLGAGALLGGHCVVGDGARLGGNAAVHQHCRVGRLSALGATSLATQDVPPFAAQAGFNAVTGLNEAGLVEAGLGPEEVEALRRAFQLIFSGGQLRPGALSRVERELGDVAVVGELVRFMREAPRGVGRAPGGKARSD